MKRRAPAVYEWLRREEGATLLEHMLLIALIAIVALAGIQSFGAGVVTNLYNVAASAFGS